MSARLGQITLIITILAVGYYFFTVAQGSVQLGKTLETVTTLETGLVAHWTFDGPSMDWSASGAEVLDSGSGGYDADASTNMGTQSSVPGVIGQALYFGGDTPEDVVTENTLSIPDDTSDDYSIAAWFKWDEVGAGNYLIAGYSGDFNTSEPYAAIFIENSTQLIKFWVRNDLGGSGEIATATSSFAATADTWYHAVAVKDGSTYTLYVDGVEEKSESATISGTFTERDHFRVGAGNNGSSEINDEFQGIIDDVRVYDRALSADEVRQLYATGGSKIGRTVTPSGLDSGLVGHWTFDGPDLDWSATSAEVLDSSGNGYDANATGSLSSQSVVPGVTGQGLRFGGEAVEDMVNTAAVDMPDDNTDDYSIAAWFNLGGNVTDGAIAGYTSTVDSSEPYAGLFVEQTTNYIKLWVRNDLGAGGEIAAATSSFAVSANTWYYGVMAKEGSTYTLYVDGEVEASKVASISGTFTRNDFRIGAANSTTEITYEYEGYIDDVRVYDRALSADEVRQLYATGGSKIGKTVTPSGLDSGLVGHWTFDGPSMDWSASGAEVLDSGSGGYDADASTNMGTQSSVPGVIGQALYFGGDTPEDVVTESTMPMVDDTTDNYSISVWLKGDEAPSAFDFVAGYTGTGDTTEPYANIYVEDTGLFRFVSRNDDGPSGIIAIATSTTSLVADEWYHVVGVKNGSNYSIYIDGVAEDVESGTITGTFADRNQFRIGGGNNGAVFNSGFKGVIDDVRVYDRALSATEIRQLYNMGR